MQANTSPAVEPKSATLAASLPPLTQIVAAATVAPKAGWRTSEFWITLAGFLGTVLAAVAGMLPPEWAGVIAPAIALSYHLVRAGAKNDRTKWLADLAEASLANFTEALTPTVIESLPMELREAAPVATPADLSAQTVEIIAHQEAALAPLKESLAGLAARSALLLLALVLAGCAASAPLQTRLVSLANAEGKAVVRIANSAADAQVKRINDAIEQALVPRK